MVLATVALWALLASLLVGCASFTLLALVPLLSNLGGTKHQSTRLPPWLTVALTSIAVGAMLGDVLLHQLPHVLDTSHHHHDHHHAHDLDVHVHDHGTQSQSLAWGTFASMLLFLVVEHVCHGFGGTHSHQDTHIHAYETRSRTANKRHSHTTPLLGRDVGWLNLVADGVHNFTDGLAIGTGFAQGGMGLGMARTWAILLHELPQEFGDFTILLSAGFSVREALTWNFVSALTSVLGTMVALLASGSAYQHPALSSTVAGVTVGGFLYLSITILNELARSSNTKHLGIVLGCCCAGFALIATVHVPH